jgi:dynein heavy chain
MTKTTSVPNSDVFTRLWVHECARVFNDRLINQEDRDFFREQVSDLLKSKFKVNWKAEEIFEGKH